ncbi:MAG: BTAD domain-containing putative transcriptional regulator [Chloroflexi bacterium]|nr:BTAD domain-containing putative transcriptional regulator [Chloroflexota bacterium]
MARLTLTFFGSFQATLAGQPLRTLQSTRLQALLAYLVLGAARPHTRDELAARFWPDEPEMVAKQNLRQALYQLRHALDEPAKGEPQPSPFLLLTRSNVQFNPASDYTLDVAAFLEQAKQQQWVHALDLYQGDLLNGLVSDSPLFEEWLVVQREALHIQALTLLDQLTQQALQQADYAAAQHYARRQLVLEPWREPAHRQLITALAASGERSAALVHYESCRRVLAAELGMEPDAATQALVEQILSGQWSNHQQERAEDRSPEESDREGKLAATAQPVVSPASHAAEHTAGLEPAEPAKPHPAIQLPFYDWGAAPEGRALYGRQAELATLQQWIVQERCRVVTVLGMGGMGKTALTVHLARSLATASGSDSQADLAAAHPLLSAEDKTIGQFDAVIWRSLLNAPPLTELLREWLLLLGKQQLTVPPANLESALTLLFEHLRRQRCLLVLDNVESIMQETASPERASYYRSGSEDYRQLFKRLGETPHQSCLLMTTRELPPEVTRLGRETPLVRTLALPGLASEAATAILKMQGLASSTPLTEQLTQRYSGNPLALLLVADTIQALFDGDLALFLQEDTLIFDDIRDVLDQQFADLSPLEATILFWLAIEREPLTTPQLAALFPYPIPTRALLEAMNRLRRRSLLEKGDAHTSPAGESGFTLQNVVTEYLTDRLVERLCTEIEQGVPQLLKNHSLLNAQAKAYVRQSQARLILQPICNRLQVKLGRAVLLRRLHTLLAGLRQETDHRATYAGGNLLNLLIHLQADLRQTDFSQLAVWQGYLQGASAPGINFRAADLTNCVFSDVFGGITALAFAPTRQSPLGADGEILAGGTTDGKIYLWRAQGAAANGQSLGVLEGHTNYVWSLIFSADGRTLISCSDDGLIHIWAIHDENRGATQRGTIVRTLRGHTAGVWRLSLSSNGHTLASAGGDHTVRLWDIRTGELLTTLPVAKGQRGLRAVAFHPNGHILAAGHETGLLQLWDTQRRVLLCTVHAHRYMLWFLSFSPDGTLLATGSHDQTIKLWSVAHLLAVNEPVEDNLLTPQQILTGHTGRVNWLCFSPDGRWLASSSVDQTVRLWDVATGALHVTKQAHEDTVGSVAFSADGKLLASGGGDHTVHVWSVDSTDILRTMRGHIQGVNSVSCAPDGGTIAIAGQDGKVRLLPLALLAPPAEGVTQQVARTAWPTEPDPKPRIPAEVQVFANHTKEVSAVAFSPNGTLLASGGADHTICLWQAQRGTLQQVLVGHRNWVRSLAFHPNGKLLLSSSSDWSVRIWDIASGEQIHILQTQKGSTWSVALSPNGETVAAGTTTHTIYLWPTYTVDQAIALHGHNAWVTTVAFSPDGQTLASGSGDQTVRLWDSATGEARAVFNGHNGWVFSVVFSPDGRWVASGGADHQVQLWELTTGRLLQTFSGHTNAVRSVVFSPDGRLLVSGSLDETVRLWDVQRSRCLDVLQVPRPYEGMNIAGVTGITAAQRVALKALGAVEIA